jgi:hypothetical protein
MTSFRSSPERQYKNQWQVLDPPLKDSTKINDKF